MQEGEYPTTATSSNHICLDYGSNPIAFFLPFWGTVANLTLPFPWAYKNVFIITTIISQ